MLIEMFRIIAAHIGSLDFFLGAVCSIMATNYVWRHFIHVIPPADKLEFLKSVAASLDRILELIDKNDYSRANNELYELRIKIMPYIAICVSSRRGKRKIKKAYEDFNNVLKCAALKDRALSKSTMGSHSDSRQAASKFLQSFE